MKIIYRISMRYLFDLFCSFLRELRLTCYFRTLFAFHKSFDYSFCIRLTSFSFPFILVYIRLISSNLSLNKSYQQITKTC